MNKLIFIPRLQRERDKFEILLNRVGFKRQMTMKGVWGGLSIKDILADVLTREQFISDRLEEILHGETYTTSTSYTALENFQRDYGYPDYESPLIEKEKLNQQVTDKYRNIGVDDIVEQELATFSNIFTALEKLSHDQCLDHDLYYRIGEHTYKSYRRAGVEIHRWLQSIASESK